MNTPKKGYSVAYDFFVKPYIKVYWLLIFFIAVTSILAPSRPYMIQLTIDRYIRYLDNPGIIKMATWMLLALLLQVVIQYCLTYLSDWLGQHIVRDLRIKLYAHSIELSIAFYNNTPIGKLITSNISDTEMIANAFNQGVTTLLVDILQLVVMVVFMVYIDWRLTILSLATLPLLLISTYFFKEKMKFAYKEVREVVSKLNTFVQSRVVGMSTIQIYNRENIEYKNFIDLSELQKQANNKSVLYYSLYMPFLEIMRAVGISLLVWYGGVYGVFQEYITVGELAAFLMYLKMFFRPLYHLAEKFNTLQMGLVAFERINKLLATQEKMANKGSYHPECLQGKVVFKDVWFAYEKETYILKNINFHIPARQSLAIVGATGAGKSTIINLLERFFDPQKGMITIDDINIAAYDIHVLRKNIGLVLQDVFLFSASIYDNITLSNSSISIEKVVEVAKLLGLHELVMKLPGSYDYNIQEGGKMLSMGQRQLLSFARVLVYNPSIVILDEATASLDNAFEKLIQQAIFQLLKNKTAIIIAHRLSTIRKADKIIVLDQGSIQEEGNHNSLIVKNGYYASLYQAQYPTF